MEIFLTDNRYEEIKRIVVELFVKYNVNCVPVSSFELATKMGIKIIPYSAFPSAKICLLLKESEDGFCVERRKGAWYIFYNDKKEYGRINNTIMHEIGHIALDHSEDSELAEKEVRFFAKYALVPPVLVHKLKIKNFKVIANIFEVSCEAARYALAYYKKWLNHKATDSIDYTDYEAKLLHLFEIA